MNFYSESEILKILLKYGTGYKNHDDPLFKDGNHLIKPFKRLGVVPAYDEDDFADIQSTNSESISCNVPGCKKNFESSSVYEHHYNNHHRFICSFCKKVQPNAHLLDLHISENHDSYFAVQSERKPMYSCFILECTHKSSNADERHDHCIREHKFPHNFRFEKIVHKKSVKSIKQINTDPMDTSDHIQLGENSNRVAKKSPESHKVLNFGHGRAKTFVSPKQHPKRKIKTTILEDNDNQMVTDLMESLPS